MNHSPKNVPNRHVLIAHVLKRCQKATESRKLPKPWAAAEQRLVARGFLSLRGGVLRGAAERVSGALCRESRGGREGLRLQGGGLSHPVVELEGLPCIRPSSPQASVSFVVDGRLPVPTAIDCVVSGVSGEY